MTRTVDHCPDCGLTAIPVDEPCPGCGFVIPNPFQWDNIRDWIRVCPVKGTDRHVLRAIADRVGAQAWDGELRQHMGRARGVCRRYRVQQVDNTPRTGAIGRKRAYRC